MAAVKRLNSMTVLFAAILLFSVLLAGRCAQAADFIFGISGPGLDDQGALQDLGWGWARVPLRWSDATGGGPEDYNAAERQISAAKGAGMRVQLTLSFGWPRGTKPAFAVDAQTGLPSDENGRSALQSFLQEAVNRFGDRIDALGVEDDLSAKAFPGGPAVYAQLLRYVSDSARAVKPGVPVVFGATDFNHMEEDQRVFYISDAIRQLGKSGVFDAIEVRVKGLNATSDYRRITGAYNHIAGELEGTPYANARILLLTDSPAQNDSEQASDLVRRAILGASLGFSAFYWDGGLVDHGMVPAGLASAQGKRKAFISAVAVGRMPASFDLNKSEIIPHGKSIYQIELPYRNGGTTTMAWRDYFAEGQSYDSSEDVQLKDLEIEGPHRIGLISLPMVPESGGILHGTEIVDKDFVLGGAPILLSQNYEMLRGLGASVPTPSSQPAAGPAGAEPPETPVPKTTRTKTIQPNPEDLAGKARLVPPDENPSELQR